MKKFLTVGIVFLSILACHKPPKKIDISTIELIPREKIPLQVTLVSPVGSVEGIRESFKILVGFNQAMTALQAIPGKRPRDR